jgi:hypothetical protein
MPNFVLHFAPLKAHLGANFEAVYLLERQAIIVA